MENSWEHFFKPEVRNRGQEEFDKGLAVVSTGSDTRIHGYVKATPLVKVSFATDSIASETFTVDCSCSASAKGAFCKHIWAILLVTQKTHPDFLDSKKNIEKAAAKSAEESPYKAKQAEYKKQQYQKQKQWAKDQRLEKKRKLSEEPRPRFAPEVEQALGFFSENGFEMENTINEENLKKAKKTLARVFHPDKGGSHAEAVILNTHFDVLMRFLESQ